MNWQGAIPTAISSLRILALPIFILFYNFGNVAACLGVLAFCAATDYFDGYFARRFGVASRFGGYYDAATDFVLMFGIFILFYAVGFYSVWLPILIAIAFAQFVVTSFFAKKLYDPVGRYLGSALYIGVVLTLLWPIAPVLAFVQYAFLVFLIISLTSRIISFTRKQAKLI